MNNELAERKRLGAKIKSMREQSGMTQAELAGLCGLNRPNLARIEAGKYSTGQDILSRIASALGKKLDII